jgi:hypothetical protein
MDAFKKIVLRGNIRNSDDRRSPNAAAHALELIPNNTAKERAPIAFSIAFIENSVLVDYAFEANIGAFLESGHKRKITFEQLKINGKTIFTRDNRLSFGAIDSVKQFLNNGFNVNDESTSFLAESSLNDEELFLANGFKVILSAKLASRITGWLNDKFMVVFRADAVQTTRKLAKSKKGGFYFDKELTEAARLFGVTSNGLGYAVDDDEADVRLCSIFNRVGKKNGLAVPSEVFESYGTVRFVNLFPFIVQAIVYGGTLIVDEFDASIHPMALMSIINIFHNDEINVHKAQLIFNTHNPIFLNANLFRRDELKFTERDAETGYSVHYSLSDFGTAGKNGVRRNEDYMKNYFVSQYGAIRDIDFSPLFESLVKDSNEV